jgi:DNA-binding MarR family transcriptional regulator
VALSTPSSLPSMENTPELSDAAEVVWLVGEVFRRSRQLVEQIVRDEGITAAQFGILKRIEHSPGMSRVEMARQNFISPQAAQIALSTLESKGLVTRRAKGAGNRAIGTHLTAKGRRVLEACHVGTEPVLEKVVTHLDLEERHLLIELLRGCLDGPPDWP